MEKPVAFWILMLLALVCGGMALRTPDNRWGLGTNIFLFLAVAVLGLHVFAGPLK